MPPQEFIRGFRLTVIEAMVASFKPLRALAEAPATRRDPGAPAQAWTSALKGQSQVPGSSNVGQKARVWKIGRCKWIIMDPFSVVLKCLELRLNDRSMRL